jgi:CheY-like chemotaxis protein
MKILIVEDEEIQIRMIDKIVSRLKKVETIRARDSFDAYTALRAIPDIDIVLVDHEMPFANGLNFVAKVKSLELFKPLKMVVISGSENQKEYDELGVDGYVDKPVSIEKLTSIISNITGHNFD